jgi:branched-chain amino acid transport system permease protein
MEYLVHILVLVGIYAILGVSLNLVAGFTGLISVAHASFFGIGAYGLALMAMQTGAPFFIGLFVGVILASLLAALIAWLSLRIHDDYFVIATLAFQVLIFSALNNWVSLTRGPMGIAGIPSPSMLGVKVGPPADFAIVAWILVAAAILFSARLVQSGYGRVLKTIREDEILAQALGKNVVFYKVQIFAVAAAFAAIAGGLYASYMSFIDPTSFSLVESIFILAVVIVGGAGSLWGPILGAALLISLPEALRFFDLPTSAVANIRQMMYGALLVAFMFWRPQGFVGEDVFTKKKAGARQ